MANYATFADHSHMHMLYDSDAFIVVRLFAEQISEVSPAPTLHRAGFEIVDKHAGKEIYLDGIWAELFQKELDSWEDGKVSQEEIETTLERYTQLAQNPVRLH